MDPEVSVIIPTYNMAQYLPDALSSVLKQTKKNIEIIVIDDGSTDNTKKTVQAISNTRDDINISYLTQSNQGRSVSVNRGIECSSSPYITFLDADDTLTPRSLEARCNALDSSPKADAILGNMKIIHHEIGLIETRKPINQPIEKWSDLYLQSGAVPAPHITLMFRKEKLDGIRFNPQMRRAQDKDFAYRIFSHLEVAYIDKILYNYERRDIPYLLKLKKQASGIKHNIYMINKHSQKKDKAKSIAKIAAWGCLKLTYEALCLNHIISPGYISNNILRKGNPKEMYPIYSTNIIKE